jgi:hypothetical protein
LECLHLITGPLKPFRTNALFLVHSRNYAPAKQLRRFITGIHALLLNVLTHILHLQFLHPKIFARSFLRLLQSQ